MVYERVKKNTSSWNPAFHQEKTESRFRPRPFSIQPEADTEESETQEIPAYSRADRDAISAKLLKTMGGDVQTQTQTQSQKPESESEGLESDEMSNETQTLQRTSESGESGDEDDDSSNGGTIQRLCDECESERHSQGMEAEESDKEMSLEAGAIQRQSESEDPEDDVKSIQAKLTVGVPGDKYEQEADSMAAQVMSMSVPAANSAPIQRQEEEEQEPLVQRSSLADSITPLVQRQTEEQEEPIQTKSLLQRAANGNAVAGTNVESQLNSSKGGGSLLPNEVRSFMEPRFGADFSGVRVHTDSTAVQMNKELGAQAFTHGNDIYFGAGKSPGKNDLTAHELTHTIQQTGGVQAKTFNERPNKANKLQSKADSRLSASSQPEIRLKENPQAHTENDNKAIPALKTTADSAKSDSGQGSQSAQTTQQSSTSSGVATSPVTPATSQHETAAKHEQAESLKTPQATEEPKSGKGATSEAAPVGAPAAAAAGTAPSTPPPAPQLDSSSSEGLLQSLSATPASSFSQALTQSKGAAAQLQSQEKSELASSLPEVDRPTGLPRMSEKRKPEITIPQTGQAPELKSAGTGAGKLPETNHEVAHGPVPGSQVSTAASAPPKDEEGGGWWNWLVNRVHNFLGAIPTNDSGLSTSAGSRPQMDLSGDANPAQMTQHQQASDQEVVDRKAQADQATAAHFGENEIYPTVPAEKLRSTYKPTAPVGKGGGGGANPPHLPDDIRATFDQHETPRLAPKVHEQLGQYRLQQAKYQKESQETRKEGQHRITQETDQVRTEQQGMQQQARGDVNAERQRWQEENRKIQDKYANQSKGKRQEIDRQVQEKVQTTDKETNQKLTDAENKADAERKKTEQQAADKKHEFENKPHSFWDSVKDGISSVFDSLKQTINSLFEGLRQIVKGIIEAAKTAVRTLIEAARTVIVGLIKGYGEFLKGLVSVALFAFPETAAKARAWIDKRVDTAVDAVNKAAETLKKATNAILDWVGQTLDKALSLVQGAFNLILDGLEFLAKAPFEAMELLEKFVNWLKEHGSFIEGLEKLQGSAAAIEAEAHKTLQGMIDQIPAKAHEAIEAAMQKLGTPSKDSSSQPTIQLKEEAGSKSTASPLQKHLQGIWRHLEPGLEHIKANWWGEVKQMVWNLVWPFNDKSPIWKDVPELIKLPGKIFSSIWNGQFSQAVDQFLLIQQKINSILGVFYGWFFIACILVGAIIGSIFPGGGTLAGAGAGLAFAGEVGEALLIAMVATETAVIGKAVYDLAFGPGTEQVNESAYDRIANSSLTLGITGVMMVLGEIAGEIASELVSGIKSIFKGEVPEAGGVRVEAPEVKGDAPEIKGDTPEVKGDTPEVKGDIPESKGEAPEVKPETPKDAPEVKGEGPEAKGETPEVIDGERVVAEEPIADGHKVKITEEGRCLICSTCEEIQIKYDEELNIKSEKIDQVKADLETAKQMPNGEAKAKATAEIEKALAEIRNNKLSELQKRLGLSDEAVRILQENQVKPSLVEKLVDAKITPDDIALRADVPHGLDILEGLVDKGVPPNRALRVVDWAQACGGLDHVNTLISGGKLKNPKSLPNLLEEINGGDFNKFKELADAAELASKGHEVELSANKKADVVDHTAEQRIESKEVSSKEESAVTDNMTKAEKQLAGEHGANLDKNSTTGQFYEGVIDIRLNNANNELAFADRVALSKFINETLQGKKMPDGTPAVQEVRFRNLRYKDPQVFKGPDFKP